MTSRGESGAADLLERPLLFRKSRKIHGLKYGDEIENQLLDGYRQRKLFLAEGLRTNKRCLLRELAVNSLVDRLQALPGPWSHGPNTPAIRSPNALKPPMKRTMSSHATLL